LALARQEHLSVAKVAEFDSRPHRLHRAEVTATQLGISRAEALDLHCRAKQGDDEARLRIRQARTQHDNDGDELELPLQEDQPVTEKRSAESAATEAKHTGLDVAAATGHALHPRLAATWTQRRMEPVAALELLATQVLVTVVQALQPSVASAGQAPGMPSKCNKGRKLEALAAPSRRAMVCQNLLSRKMSEQPRRHLGRRGH
jgi:hypothetical protein